MMNAARYKKLSALFVMGENPALSFPGTHGVEKALDSLDFLVVSDLFLTDTAQHAHVVFPVMGFPEKNGTYTNLERRVQKVRTSVTALEGHKSDWEILCQIALRMGYDMHYNHPEEIFAEIRRVIPSYRGISYDRLEGEMGVQWPCPADADTGCEILGAKEFPGGKGRFIPVVYQASGKVGDESFPYLLLQGGSLFHHQTGTMSRKTFGLTTLASEAEIKINPADATNIGVENGDQVSVRSPDGQITLVANISDEFQPGTVYASKHFNSALPNSLFSGKSGNNIGMPEMKHVRVAIRKL